MGKHIHGGASLISIVAKKFFWLEKNDRKKLDQTCNIKMFRFYFSRFDVDIKKGASNALNGITIYVVESCIIKSKSS